MLLLALLACSGTPSPPPTAPPTERVAPVPDRLAGICDGSAAVRLPDGGLLVAYDEDTALHRFGADGSRGADGPLHRLLGTSDHPEYDLEAAALVPGPEAEARIWWVGSHGRDGSDALAPARHHFFATNVPEAEDLSDLAVVEPALDLLPVLFANPQVAARFDGAVRARGSKAGGVNLEAMATHPDGGLVLGFRSPLSSDDGLHGTALLVHLDRSDAGWAVQSSHELDLGDRGFRDLVADGDGWRVVAGPVDDGAFALFRLDADLSVHPWLGEQALGGLRPEALVPDGDGWLLLSDDGKVKRPDPTAKDGDRGCDKIRKEHGADHPQVYLRTRRLPAG